jgi:uncharacterized protein (TIGR02996 family)
VPHVKGDDLLAAVLRDPDDEAVRLVYADWLEERGDPRGEFIRVQCELARMDAARPVILSAYSSCSWGMWEALADAVDVPGRSELEAREAALLEEHQDEWLGGLAELEAAEWRFRRGFVESVNLIAEDYLENAAALARAAPIRDVEVEDVGGHIAALAALPQLGRLRSLSLKGEPQEDAESIRPLAASPRLAGLKRLEVFNHYFGDEGAAALAASRRLAGLEVLYLEDCAIGAAGAKALAGSRQLRGLTGLGLFGNDIGARGAAALAASPLLGRLTALDLTSCELGDDGARALAASAGLARLRVLVLCHNDIGPDGARALAASPHLANVEALCLAQNRVGSQGAAALAASASLGRLRALSLLDNGVGNPGVRALAASRALSGLRVLDLCSNPRIDCGGVQELAFSKKLRGLTRLGLGGTTVGDAGASVLAGFPQMGGLRRLNLYDTHVGDEGADALLRSRYLTRLEELDLPEDRLSANMRRALKRRFGAEGDQDE